VRQIAEPKSCARGFAAPYAANPAAAAVTSAGPPIIQGFIACILAR